METAIRKDLKTFLDSWQKNNKTKIEYRFPRGTEMCIISFETFFIELDYPRDTEDGLIFIKVIESPNRLRYIGIENEDKLIKALEGAEPDMNKIIDRLNNA